VLLTGRCLLLADTAHLAFCAAAAAAAAAAAVSAVVNRLNTWLLLSHVASLKEAGRPLSLQVSTPRPRSRISAVVDDVLCRPTVPCCRPHSTVVVVHSLDSMARRSWLHYGDRCRRRHHVADESAGG